MAIRVIAIDDHPLILKALQDLLDDYPDLALVATANHGSKLLALVREHLPDVAIVDLGMSSGYFDPISSVKTVREQYPGIKVLILTGYDDKLWAREMMRAGASGYMLKSDDFSIHIPQAIRAIHEGKTFLSPGVAEILLEPHEQIVLTDRETAVLNMISNGYSTEAIAGQLTVSEKRIRNMLVTICDKLKVDRGTGVSLRIAAVNRARKLGLLPNSPNIDSTGHLHQS